MEKRRFLPRITFVLASLAMIFAGLFAARWWSQPPTPPELHRTLKLPHGRLLVMRSDTNREHVYLGTSEGWVLILNEQAQLLVELDSKTESAIIALDVAPSGEIIATHWNGAATRWTKGDDLRFDDPKPIELEPATPISDAERAYLAKLAIRPGDGPRDLAVAFHNGEVEVFRPGVVSTQHKPANNSRIDTLQYTPDGKLLLAGTEDGKLMIIDGETRQLVETRSPGTAGILCIECDGNRRFLTGDTAGSLIVWDRDSLSRDKILAQPDAVNCAGWLDVRVITGSWDGGLRVWQLDKSKPVSHIRTGKPILALHTVGETVFTIDGSDLLRIWKP